MSSRESDAAGQGGEPGGLGYSELLDRARELAVELHGEGMGYAEIVAVGHLLAEHAIEGGPGPEIRYVSIDQFQQASKA